MRKISLYLSFLFILIFFGVCVSANTIGVDNIYRVDTPINYQQTCTNNGTFCSSTALCNITVLSPNSTIIINNKPMTNNIAFFNYTIPQQTQLGTWSTNIQCIDSGVNGYNTYTFELTPTGQELTTSQSIIYGFGLFLCMIFFFASIFGAIVIPWRNPRSDDASLVVGVNDLKYVKLILWFVSYILIIATTYLAWNLSLGFEYFNTAANIFQFMFWTLISFMFPIFVVFLLTAVVRFIEDIKIKDSLRKGLPYFNE